MDVLANADQRLCHHRCTDYGAKRPTQGGFSGGDFAPAFSTQSLSADRPDGPRTRDSGAHSPAPARDIPPPSLFTAQRVSPTFTRRKRKLPPGRSFGCGGAIKNSPVSGAWIADGTDVSLVDDDDDAGDLDLSRPYIATPVSLFIPRGSRARFIVTTRRSRLVFVSASSPDVACFFLRDARFIMRHRSFI